MQQAVGLTDSQSFNFPTRLNIAPLRWSDDDAPAAEQQRQWISQYGIAGRVWEAVPYLMQYLNPPGVHEATFEPPCSVFLRKSCLKPVPALRILELGSGNGHLCLHHLAPLLPPGSQLVLTDLEEVMPLLEENVRLAIDEGRIPHDVTVSVQPLPWGSRQHLDKLRIRTGNEAFTHILCSDLVYFTHLLEPLLQTLLWLTEASGSCLGQRAIDTEAIFGYKIRALHKEQAFWESLGAFFDLESVYRDLPEQDVNEEETEQSGRASSPFTEDRLLIMLAKRKRNLKHVGQTNGTPATVKPLMDCKDDQFETMLMLRSMSGY